MPPIISVIVPVRNEQRSIRRTLDSLLAQDLPQEEYEVIVADGCSTDETTSIVRELQGSHTNLKLVYNPNRWSSAGRNLGVRHMSGRVAVIVDGHCHVPDADYLRNVLTSFSESGADCLGRPQPLDAPDPTAFQAAVSLARSSRLGHNPDSDIYSNEAKFVQPQSTAVAYRRDVFETVGLFDERFDACEDVEFNQRVHDAKKTCYFTPSIKIVYDPRVNFRSLFQQLARYGAGRARLAAKHPHSLTLPALVPPLWCIWLVVGAALSFVHPLIAWTYAGSISLYLSVILLASFWLGRKQPLRILTRVPLVFLGIHFGFSWGFLKEVWHGRLDRR